MKKILIVVLMLAIGCISSDAFAEDLTGRFSIGVVGGWVFPKDSDIDDSFYIGGNFAYGINDYLAVGLEAGYTSWDDEEGGVDYGDVRAIPLLADVYLRYPIELGEKKLVPYAIGGLGFIFWDYEESSLLKNNNITVDMDAELGLKLGGGFDYFLTENFAVNLEGCYIWSEADVSVAAFGTVAAATIDTDCWMANCALKYYF